MMKMRNALGVVAMVALAACASPDRFESEPNASISPELGGASDPASPQYFTQTIGDRVLFEVDQATLTPQARVTLDGQAQWLLTNSDYIARIEGHADEQGTREYNIGLSNRRAVAVQQYLVSKGVAENRLSTVGYGKERPIAICSDESCYSQNRRAVTILTGGVLG